MAIALNDNISINAPKLVDDRTKKSDGSAYTSKADVLANLVASRRAVGLMVLINEELHYFKTGVTLQSDLVKLSSGDLPANMVLTLSGDLVDNTDPSNPIIVFNQSTYDISNFANASVNPFVRQNALDNKVDKITGRGLSEANYTNSEKTKLSGIESNAQVNKLEKIYIDGAELLITDKSVYISSTEIPHNELSGLQGGKSNEPKEYFHLSESQHERVLDLIYINNSSSFSVSPTSGERGALQALTVSYNIQTKDDLFTDASINQGIGSVFANINTGTKTISGGTATQNKTFTLTLNYARNGVATTETKTATYTTYLPQFAGVSASTDFANLAAIVAASFQKFVQASNAISKQSSPTGQYIWFVSTKNNASILDQNNFSQSVGTWGDGTSEFYQKALVITLADATTETVYLYRSRNVKTLTNFTYKIQ